MNLDSNRWNREKITDTALSNEGVALILMDMLADIRKIAQDKDWSEINKQEEDVSTSMLFRAYKAGFRAGEERLLCVMSDSLADKNDVYESMLEWEDQGRP